MDGKCAHNLVAVNNVAIAVHSQAAVGIAIVSNTKISFGSNGQGLKLLGMSGTSLVVNVAPIGSRINDNGIGARLTEGFGSKERRTTIGAVNRDA